MGPLSWSAGLIPAARLAAEGQVAFLIDAEGPTDRFSLIHPRASAVELEELPLGEDAFWQEKEALNCLIHLKCPYLRLQGSIDHVHGSMELHARRALAATSLGEGAWFSGSLYEHGTEILKLLKDFILKSCSDKVHSHSDHKTLR